MHLKHTLIFSILIISVYPAFAMSDTEVMNKYANPSALQNAIDSGEVDYGSLPSDIQVAVHPYQPNNPTQHMFDYMWTLLIPIIVGPLLIFGVKFLRRIKFVSHKIKSKPKGIDLNYPGMPKGWRPDEEKEEPRIKSHHDFLIKLGLAKVVKK